MFPCHGGLEACPVIYPAEPAGVGLVNEMAAGDYPTLLLYCKVCKGKSLRLPIVYSISSEAEFSGNISQ
ncbi:hypothetical protein AYI75_20475 [Shewanella algae]|nr:hypothetical protein AYI75_20475 [Shewanella algae]